MLAGAGPGLEPDCLLGPVRWLTSCRRDTQAAGLTFKSPTLHSFPFYFCFSRKELTFPKSEEFHFKRWFPFSWVTWKWRRENENTQIMCIFLLGNGGFFSQDLFLRSPTCRKRYLPLFALTRRETDFPFLAQLSKAAPNSRSKEKGVMIEPFEVLAPKDNLRSHVETERPLHHRRELM